MHLLADANVAIGTATDSTDFLVQYQVHVYNMGTISCDSIDSSITFDWPSNVPSRITHGQWTGIVEPFAPGASGTYYGDWTIESKGVAVSDLEQVKIKVSCLRPKGDYVNVVIPQIIRK